MIEWSFPTYSCTMYHTWDVSPDQIVPWATADKTDAGKYVMFDDGSELLAMIYNTTSKVVITSSGQYRRSDIVHCAVPKNPTTSVYGLWTQDISPKVKPFNNREHIAANQIIEHGKCDSKVTRRIRMLVTDKIQEAVEDYGVDEDEIAKVLVGSIRPDSPYWSRGKNMQFAITQIMRVNKVDITGKLVNGSGERPLIASTGRSGVKLSAPPDEEVVPTIKDIRKLLGLGGVAISKPEEVEVVNGS